MSEASEPKKTGGSEALKAAARARAERKRELFERLIAAVEADDAAQASLLIEQGAPLTRRGRASALSRALESSAPRAALACVRGGASALEPGKFGHRISAYDHAVDSGVGEVFAAMGARGDDALKELPPAWMELALALLEAGANPNEADHEGVSALISAAIFNQPRLIAGLLERGADLEAADKYGNTALICAAGSGAIDALRVLIQAGANVSAAGFKGQNAALRALQMGHARTLTRAKCVAELLMAGCDPDQLNAEGDSARRAIQRALLSAKAAGEELGELRSALERWDIARGCQGARAKVKKTL